MLVSFGPAGPTRAADDLGHTLEQTLEGRAELIRRVEEPLVFLFDGPLSNLDAGLRAQRRIEIGGLQRRLKTTTVYVTHDQVEAMTLGDRIVVLANGRIQQVGTPIELYRSPVNRFVAGFIGKAPMNFIDGAVEVTNGRQVFVAEGICLDLPAGRLRGACCWWNGWAAPATSTSRSGATG